VSIAEQGHHPLTGGSDLLNLFRPRLTRARSPKWHDIFDRADDGAVSTNPFVGSIPGADIR
jgi:hypothetical protein